MKLFESQKLALDWALSRDRVALFLEMRLGKTLAAIYWAESHEPESVLVLCPKSVLSVWEDALASVGIHALNWHATEHVLPDPVVDIRWFLVNYEAFRREEFLQRTGWDIVILDESVRIKNPKSQITRVVLRNVRANRRAILSGLPAPESIQDYYCQMAFLFDGWMGCRNFWEWRTRFFQLSGYDWFPTKDSKRLIESRIANDSFSLQRRTLNLGPTKIYERRKIDPPKPLLLTYKKIKQDWELSTDRTTKYIVVTLTWLHQLTGGFFERFPFSHKVDALIELIECQPFDSRRILVWCRFIAEIEGLWKILKDRYDVRIIRGSTSVKDRRKIANRFQSSEKPTILLAQIQTVKMGIDLSNADIIVYYSNSWSYDDRSQSEDRAIHLHRKKPVLVVDLVTRNLIDADIVQILRGKKLTAKLTLERLAKRLSHSQF